MADFILSPLTGDLDLGINNSEGLKLHSEVGQEAAQRINQSVQINIGEWFANILSGLPILRNVNENLPQNIRYFLGEKTPDAPRFVFNSLNTYINSLPFVTRLVDSSFTFDKANREFIYSFSAEIEEHGVIFFPPIRYEFT